MRSRCVLACALLVAVVGCRDGRVEAGFWFEDVTFNSPTLGGPITDAEMDIIKSLAASELTAAFNGLHLRFSDRRRARFRVRVVQELRDPRFRRRIGSAGQSRTVTGFGGMGEVSFSFLASGAVAYAPLNADRPAIIAAIGRAVGRTAVHEFTHLFLPTAAIHDSQNLRSYEHASAARPEHYYGDVEWDLAWPLLKARLGGG